MGPVYCPGTAVRPVSKGSIDANLSCFSSTAFSPSSPHINRLVGSPSLIRLLRVLPLAAMFFPTSLFLLGAAAAAQATTINVQVGSSNGTLAFSPETVVSIHCPSQKIPSVEYHPRALNQATKLSSRSSKRTTVRRSPRSPAHVPPCLVVSTLACKLFFPSDTLLC